MLDDDALPVRWHSGRNMVVVVVVVVVDGGGSGGGVRSRRSVLRGVSL
jgi:hypothetical protein